MRQNHTKTISIQLFIAALAGGCGERRHAEGDRGWSAVPYKSRRSERALAPPAGEVHMAYEHLGMSTGRRDPVTGMPLRIRCATCHDKIAPKKRNADATRLEAFHRGIEIEHGDQPCRSCHQAPRFERFRYLGGETVPYAQVMKLCGQCHSTQLRDYLHGAHGGMTGYWDRTRGKRDRNHCIDCHNPHRPAIPKVTPAARARYRLLAGERAKLEGERP